MSDTLIQPQTLTHAGTYVDLTFPAFGGAIPLDHGYALYGALAKLIPWLHGDEAKAERAGVFPIRGTPGGDRTLLLGPGSLLRLRVPATRLPALLPLAGRTLLLDGFRMNIGVPTVHALTPAATLISPLVLIKLADARPQGGGRGDGDRVPPDAFLAAARRQLDALTIAGDIGLLTHANGPTPANPAAA